MTQQITPFLRSDDNADEAVNFSSFNFSKTAVFSDATRYGEAGPGPKGTDNDCDVRIERTALHRPEWRSALQIHGSSFVCSEDARRRKKLITTGDKLLDGGEAQRCGWLKDRFGLSWQIVPVQLSAELFGGNDPQRAGRVMQAMMQMVKFDLAKLKEAYAG